MKSIIFYNKRIIQQLFLEFNVAWFIWRIVHRIWLTTTNWYEFFLNMVTINGSKGMIWFFVQIWLQQMDPKLRSQIWVGACAFFVVYMVLTKKINYSLIYMLFLGQPRGCSSSQCFKRSSANKIWSGYAEWWRLQQFRIFLKIGRGLLIG